MVQGEVYCALCGSATTCCYERWIRGLGYINQYYDDSVTRANGLWWLSRTSLLTEDLGGVGITFTHSARNIDDGCFIYGISPTDIVYQYTYNYDKDLPVAFPIHWACFEEFKKMIEPGEGDLECFYKVLKKFSSPFPSRCLSLNYHGAEMFMGSQWRVLRGAEDYVTSPSRDVYLVYYYSQLERHLPERTDDVRPIKSTLTPRDDPFVKFPPEVVFLIMNHMNMVDAWRWRGASRWIASMAWSNKLWGLKLIREMPWLYDLYILKQGPDSTVNWKALYMVLYRAATKRGQYMVTALANRKRIWQTCLPLVEAYHEEKAIQDRAKEVIPGTMIDAVVDTESKPWHKTYRELVLLREFDDLDSIHPKIVTTWTRDDELKRIDVGHCDFVFQVGTYLPLSNQVFFPEDGWLMEIWVSTNTIFDVWPIRRKVVGISFRFSIPPANGHAEFGAEESDDLWVLAARRGHFIVGLKVYEDGDGKLLGLELIQQPVTKLRPQRRRLLYDVVDKWGLGEEDVLEEFWV